MSERPDMVESVALSATVTLYLGDCLDVLPTLDAI